MSACATSSHVFNCLRHYVPNRDARKIVEQKRDRVRYYYNFFFFLYLSFWSRKEETIACIKNEEIKLREKKTLLS